MATKKSSSTPRKKQSAQEIEYLRQENKALKAELKAAHIPEGSVKPRRSFWRSAFAGFFALLAVVSFSLFNVAYWSKTTITDTNQFVSTMQPLIKDKAIQKAIQTEVTNKLFEQINLEKELKAALPENVQFIAAPLAGQVKSFTYSKIGDVLNSEQANKVWIITLTEGHKQIMAYIENPNNDGKVTVNDIYQLAGNQLKNSDVGFLFGKQLPSSFGTITLAKIDGVPKARLAINKLQNLTTALLATAIISLILAIAMSYKRRNMIIGISVATFFTMILTNQAYIYLRHVIAEQTLPQYSAAAESIVTIVTKPLILQTRGVAALIGAGILIAILSSNWPSIVAVRRFVRRILDAITSRIVRGWKGSSYVDWIAKNSSVISITLTAVGFALFAFRLPPTTTGVIDALIFTVIAVLSVEVVASVSRSTHRTK